MRRQTILWMLLLLLLAPGCGGATTVRAEVVRPAAIPVRSFPRVWVGTGHLPEEARVAGALVRHLESEGLVEVRRVDVGELEPARTAGRIPQATVVVLLGLEMEERTRAEWGTRPETVCGPAGCFTSHRSYAYDVPTLTARLSVTVYDGPSARVQQHLVISERQEGRDYETMRPRAVRELVERLSRMVDQRTVPVEVELLEVELPAVQRAVSKMEEGQWSSGRRVLEEVVRSDAYRALPAEDRARVLYDLGQARRFDPETLDEPAQHFRASRRAFEAAIRLDPRDLYDRASRALERHRRQVEVVRGQRAAARHNFRIGSGSTDLPEPPASYRQEAEPSDAPAGPEPQSSDAPGGPDAP